MLGFVDYATGEEDAMMDIAEAHMEGISEKRILELYNKAIFYFRSSEPTAKIVHQLALCYASTSRWAEAEENFNRSLSICKDGLVYYNWGISLRKQGKILEANDVFKKALKCKKWWWLWEPRWYGATKIAITKLL